MHNNDDYPIGTDTSDAPWNQKENPEREIEVTVSVTLSKTIKVKVSDYDIINSGIDEDGNYFEEVDYSNCDLKGAVEDQCLLPQGAYRCINCISGSRWIDCPETEMLEGWNVDEFEVIKE